MDEENKIIFLIGSSASGKTTAAKTIEEMNIPSLIVCYSDSKRVPSTEEMVKDFGTQEEWQKQNTFDWVSYIKENYLDENDVIFDLQSRPSFIKEACEKNNITSYKIILFDCSDEERIYRLIEKRRQPDLANEQMLNWAKFLREVCLQEGFEIIDNTDLPPEESVKRLLSLV